MDPVRWERLLSLYSLALDRPKSERTSWLRSAVEADPSLVDEVLALLENDEKAGNFLNPAGDDDVFAAGNLIANRFRIEGRLGRGGMGTVYAALDLALNEPVALKVVNSMQILPSTAQAMLRTEALLVRKLSHRNICRVHDVIEHTVNRASWTVVVMEQLTGQTLAQRLKDGKPLNESEALPIIQQILAALTQAHADGIVHRDLKPANIMISGDQGGRVVVMDFGLAKSMPPPGEPGVSNGALLAGTPEYMAPEQLRGLPADPRAVLYSLGVIMYECIAGARPSAGRHGLSEVVGRLVDRPTSLRSSGFQVSSAYDAVALRCLEADPANRFASATEVQAALNSTSRIPALPAMPRRTMLFAGLAAAGSATAFIGYRTYNSLTSHIPSAVVLIAPTGGNSDLSLLESYLRRQLDQSTTVKSWEMRKLPEVTTSLRIDPRRPRDITTTEWRQIAARGGAHFVLHSTVSTLAGVSNLQCVLERIDPNNSQVLRQWDHTRNFRNNSEALAAVAGVSTWVRQLSGESISDITANDRSPDLVTTASFEAFRLFELAESSIGKNRKEAIALLREAIHIDPQFAIAWMRLGDQLVADHDWLAGYDAWRRAVSLADAGRLSVRESHRIRTLYAYDCGDYPAVESAALRWHAALPGDVQPLWELFQSRFLRRLAHAAEEVLPKLAEFGKQSRQHLLAQMMVGFATGDVDRIENGAKRFQASPFAGFAGIKVLIAVAGIRGRWGQAAETTQQLSRSPRLIDNSHAYTFLAAIEAASGNFAASAEKVQQGIRHDLEQGVPQLLPLKYLSLAYLAWLQGQKDQCRAFVNEALGKKVSLQKVPLAVALLYRSGFTVEADALRAQFKAPAVPLFDKYQHWMRAEQLLAAGACDQALSAALQFTSLQPLYEPPEPRIHASLRSGQWNQFSKVSGDLDLASIQMWYSAENHPAGMLAFLANPSTILSEGLICH